ncbi:MAG: MFS transporter [Candidatus Bathyarchaeia archaeon]
MRRQQTHRKIEMSEFRQVQASLRRLTPNETTAGSDPQSRDGPQPANDLPRVDHKRQLLALYLAMLVTRIGFGSVLLLFPMYLAVGSFGVGIALSAYPLAEFVSAAPIGTYVDLKGRRRMLLLGLLSISLLTMTISLTRNSYVIAIIHAIMGFSGAAVTVSSLTMITDLTAVSNRGVSMGGFDFSNILGYALGISFATTVLHLTGRNYGFAFVATGILLLAASVTSIIWVKETSHPSTPRSYKVNPLIALDQNTRAILPLWLGLTTILGVVFVLPRSLMESGLRFSQVGLTLALGAFVLGIGSLVFGRISDKIGRGKTLGIGVVGLTLVLISTLEAVSHSPPRVYEQLPLIALGGFMATATVPSALAYVGDKANRGLRGSAMGIYSMMLSLGMGIGNLVGGYSTSVGGLRAILETSAVVLLLSLPITVLLLYRAGSLHLR